MVAAHCSPSVSGRRAQAQNAWAELAAAENRRAQPANGACAAPPWSAMPAKAGHRAFALHNHFRAVCMARSQRRSKGAGRKPGGRELAPFPVAETSVRKVTPLLVFVPRFGSANCVLNSWSQGRCFSFARDSETVPAGTLGRSESQRQAIDACLPLFQHRQGHTAEWEEASLAKTNEIGVD